MGVPGAKGALPGPVSLPRTGNGSMWPAAHPSPAGPRWRRCDVALELGADLLRAFSSLGLEPGQAFGEMFLPLGCRRSFPREPSSPWQAGQLLPHALSPQNIWNEPPWEHELGQGRGGWQLLPPWDHRPFQGPANFHGNEEDRRWAPYNSPLVLPRDNGEDRREPVDCFGGDWQLHRFLDSRPLHVPADFPWNENDRGWAPRQSPWDDRGDNRGDNRGPVGCFREAWHPEPLPPSHGRFVWPEFPDKEQHPPWPHTSLPGERGSFQDGSPFSGCHGLGGKPWRHRHRGRRELTLVQHQPCLRPSAGNRASSRSTPSVSGTSQSEVKEKLQHCDPSQPLNSSKDGVQSRRQTAQGPLAEKERDPKSPGPDRTPQKSPDTDTHAAEPEEAAEAMPVKPGARQKPADSNGQSPSALETEPAPPEESSAGTGDCLECFAQVEPSSESVPKAGAGGGSRPQSPTAPPEPAEMDHAAASSAGELLSGLQPPENSQVPLAVTAEPDAQPSQACSDTCAAPETSPRTQHPPGSGEMELAAGSEHQLCSELPMSSLASTDLRSAAVLARKKEIELSYQQFSLTIAVVATMLLQKEPSMEAALGLALRANLRQGRIHHLQELEDFIDSYDSATLSR
ncbi:uncharacterized protein LOC135316864 isoform X4 [Phalacrocorax carbo]|uniref:uncharacterized protein LOC135316864 isoform X4 n=1 Tax=Phalacrocorax carbo TaxID=9209 RepID=UPI00311A00FB